MLLERNGKFTMWKSKSSRLSYSLVESLPPLSMNIRSEHTKEESENNNTLKRLPQQAAQEARLRLRELMNANDETI